MWQPRILSVLASLTNLTRPSPWPMARALLLAMKLNFPTCQPQPESGLNTTQAVEHLRTSAHSQQLPVQCEQTSRTALTC